MNKRSLSVFVLLVLVALAFSVQAQDSDPQSPVAEPLGPQFTYQGQLKNETGVPINDACDLTFGLWDAASGGAQVGADNVVTGVVVTEGYFTAVLNTTAQFGNSAFNGEARWLETAVRCPAGGGEYTTLSPRQPLDAAPYASYALNVPAHDHWGEEWSGTDTAATGLTISGGNWGLESSGWTYGVYGLADSTIGRGVAGVAAANTGMNYGVRGTSLSPEGYGVHGSNDDGVGVFGTSDNGVAVAAGGNGVFHSTADTVIYLSPFTAMRRDGFTDLTFTPLDNGGVRVKKVGAATGERLVVIPISTAGVAFGTPVYVKALEVCYKTSAATGYISGTGVYKGNGEAWAGYLSDPTPHTSLTRQCYTINATTRSVIDNSSYAQIHLYFTNTTEPEITLFTVKLTLSEMSE